MERFRIDLRMMRRWKSFGHHAANEAVDHPEGLADQGLTTCEIGCPRNLRRNWRQGSRRRKVDLPFCLITRCSTGTLFPLVRRHSDLARDRAASRSASPLPTSCDADQGPGAQGSRGDFRQTRSCRGEQIDAISKLPACVRVEDAQILSHILYGKTVKIRSGH